MSRENSLMLLHFIDVSLFRQWRKITTNSPVVQPILSTIVESQSIFQSFFQKIINVFTIYQKFLSNTINPLTTNVPHHIIPVNWFPMQINWLVSIRWGTLVVNGLKSFLCYHAFFWCHFLRTLNIFYPFFNLKISIRAYSLMMNRITRSVNIVAILTNNKDRKQKKLLSIFVFKMLKLLVILFIIF